MKRMFMKSLIRIFIFITLMVITGKGFLTPGFSQKPVQLIPTFISEFDGSQTPSGKFRSAAAIDIDGGENVYIVDSGNHRLIKFDSQGRFIREVGGFGRQEDQFDTPLDVCARNTINIYVADYNNGRVVRFDKNLNFLSDFVSTFEEPYHFERVRSLVVSSQNDLFILEDINNRIIKFNASLGPVISFGGFNEPYGQLLEPYQVALDNKTRLWISDRVQNALVIFDYFGNFILTLTHPDLEQPRGIFAGSDNYIYVVNGKNQEVFVFNPEFKLVTRIRIPAEEEQIVDVAVQFNKTSRVRRLYVLSSKACRIFQLKFK